MIWGAHDPLALAERALCDVETCVRDGEFGHLPEALAKMDRAMVAIRREKLNRSAVDGLVGLRAHAARVGQLLTAVMAGMRDARASLATPTGFSSYDAHGQTGRISPAQPRFERRR